MHFYIFSGSVFVSIFTKCLDLENSQKNTLNEVKLQHYHAFLLSIKKKNNSQLILYFCLFQVNRALKVA